WRAAENRRQQRRDEAKIRIEHTPPDQDRDQHRNRPRDDQQRANDALSRQIIEQERDHQPDNEAEKHRGERERDIPNEHTRQRLAETSITEKLVEIAQTNELNRAERQHLSRLGREGAFNGAVDLARFLI